MAEYKITKEEALKLLKGGPKGITKWNELREEEFIDTGKLEWVNLDGVDLSKQDLLDANLTYVSLEGADLHKAKLHEVSFSLLINNINNIEGAILKNANMDNTEWSSKNVIRTNPFYGVSTLENASLRNTDLSEVRFCRRSIKGVNFQGSKLENAIFDQINLSQVNFRDTNLRGANLSNTRNLSAHQLGGADLSGATPPDSIKEFGALKTVEIQSAYLRKLFVTLVAACVFCTITIANTTDVELLTNQASSPLPIIGGNISIVAFFTAGAFLLLCFYVFFLLNVQRNFETLSELPAFFWDGQPLHKRAYPWLTNGLVLWLYPRLKVVRPPFWRLQVFVSVIIIWIMVPFVLDLFFQAFLPRHDWTGTKILIILNGFSAFFCVNFILQAIFTLKGKNSTYKLSKTKKEKIYLSLTCFILAVLAAFVWSGRRSYNADSAINKGEKTANFIEQNVSEKPIGWTGSDEQVKFVRGANLRWLDLRNLHAQGAFLVNADLRGADLRGADLGKADLRGANLNGAIMNKDTKLHFTDLGGANLIGSCLKEVNFCFTNLSGANLSGANLTMSNLGMTDLSMANLSWADLSGASLLETNLHGADLYMAKLEGIKQWQTIKSLRNAIISEVRNPPDDFVEWAKKKEAIGIKSFVDYIYKWIEEQSPPKKTGGVPTPKG